MANKPTLLINFQFDYDGTTATIVVNPKTGPVFLTNQVGFTELTPAFNATVTGVISGSVTITDNATQPVATTASVAGGNLTVNIPAGFSAGPLYCTATISF